MPGLAIALGFTTFAYGAIVGVAIQVQLAGGPRIFSMSENLVGAHASAMVFGYLILVATGLLEWRILGTRGMPRSGLIQVGGLFVAGAALSLTLLFLPASALQPVGGLNLLLNLIAVGIFAARIPAEGAAHELDGRPRPPLRRLRRLRAGRDGVLPVPDLQGDQRPVARR